MSLDEIIAAFERNVPVLLRDTGERVTINSIWRKRDVAMVEVCTEGGLKFWRQPGTLAEAGDA